MKKRDVKHVSAEEKRKGVIIFVLLGILAAIFLTIIIIMIPKGNDDVVVEDIVPNRQKIIVNETSNNANKNPATSRRNGNTIGSGTDIITKDKNKVSITIKSDTLTPDGAVIIITDTNVSPYSWTPIYRLQQKIDGKWEDMELKNPENAIFAEIEYNNRTGTMEQSLVWGNKYGSLGTGTYRIVKEAGGIEFYAEFEFKQQ